MPKKKRFRIHAIKSFDNVSEHAEEWQGKWHSHVFHNDHPITLEVGCGKGEYTIAMASHYPQRNFIGIDLKGARLWVGAKKAQEMNLNNVFFIRGHVKNLAQMFLPNTIEEMWIPFPDPFPQKPRKRMIAPRALRVYQHILKPRANIFLKTDDNYLYHFAQESIKKVGGSIFHATEDLYSDTVDNEFAQHATTFEKNHIELGKKIKYIHFTLPEFDKDL